MRTVLDKLTNSDKEIMTNFGHTIDHEVAEEIKASGEYASYSGWNFWGAVWWVNDFWNCEVWVYKFSREIIQADSLSEIMERVSEKYGYE